MMLVGNNSHLREEQRKVRTLDGRNLANQFGCGFAEASARYNEHVAEAFEGLLARIEERHVF